MKRIQILSDGSPNFIGCWSLNNNIFCDDIIKFFEKNETLQKQGRTIIGINTKHKKTKDITIEPNKLMEPDHEVFKIYLQQLHDCYMDYKDQWPFLDKFLKKIHIPPFNIQKYSPGDHYSHLHSERTSLSSLHRIFAFMTYLNDVDDGGTTDFEYYKLKIKPEKGKTLIWPSEWTHAHSGSVLKSGSKYIITGWLHFSP